VRRAGKILQQRAASFEQIGDAAALLANSVLDEVARGRVPHGPVGDARLAKRLRAQQVCEHHANQESHQRDDRNGNDHDDLELRDRFPEAKQPRPAHQRQALDGDDPDEADVRLQLLQRAQHGRTHAMQDAWVSRGRGGRWCLHALVNQRQQASVAWADLADADRRACVAHSDQPAQQREAGCRVQRLQSAAIEDSGGVRRQRQRADLGGYRRQVRQSPRTLEVQHGRVGLRRALDPACGLCHARPAQYAYSKTGSALIAALVAPGNTIRPLRCVSW
jgi:hypothetical protein